MMNSPSDEEKALLELMREEASEAPTTQTETTAPAVMTVATSAFGLTPSRMPGVDYHVWQNLSTGECVLRPAQPSLGIPQRQMSGNASRVSSRMEAPGHRQRIGGEEAKRERISWTGELQEVFEHAVHELGNDATPKPIMKILHERGYHYVTREHVSSHLQKYRLKKSATESTATESDVQEESDG